MARTVTAEERLTNYDVWFLMKLLNAHMEGAYLLPGKGETHENFKSYQQSLILKLRALDLDKVYEE